MLSNKGFDLWADGYDKSVGLSDEDGTIPLLGIEQSSIRYITGCSTVAKRCWTLVLALVH